MTCTIDPRFYHEHSGLQYAIGQESLSHLNLLGNETALDLGCGDGKLTAELAKRLPHGQVTGWDRSLEMVAFAKETYPHISFVHHDVSHLTAHQAYDLITAQLLIHFIEDKKALLEAIHQALKPGGYFLLTTTTTESPYTRVILKLLQDPRWRPYTYKSASIVDYLQIVKAADFEFITVTLQSRLFEPGELRLLRAHIKGFLPMLAALPHDLADALLEELISALRVFEDPTTGQFKIPFKTLVLLLRRP